jgi:predicted secreted protein
VLRVVPLLAVLLAASAACGGSDASTPPEGGGPDAPQAEAGDAITEADAGRSLTLAEGAETSLQLSSEYVWTDPVLEGAAVELSPVDYLQDPGFSEWLVHAVGPGTATISSLGEPACAGEDGCPDEPLRFQVTITVAE